MTSSTLRRSTTREWLRFRISSSSNVWLAKSGTFTLSSRFLSLFSSILDIQVFHEFSMRLYKVFAQLYLCTHQFIEYSIRFFSVIYSDLNQYTLLRIHGRFK